jgi:hypothetical protein
MLGLPDADAGRVQLVALSSLKLSRLHYHVRGSTNLPLPLPLCPVRPRDMELIFVGIWLQSAS